MVCAGVRPRFLQGLFGQEIREMNRKHSSVRVDKFRPKVSSFCPVHLWYKNLGRTLVREAGPSRLNIRGRSVSAGLKPAAIEKPPQRLGSQRLDPEGTALQAASGRIPSESDQV